MANTQLLPRRLLLIASVAVIIALSGCGALSAPTSSPAASAVASASAIAEPSDRASQTPAGASTGSASASVASGGVESSTVANASASGAASPTSPASSVADATGTAQPASGAADYDAAVQTIVSFYDLINQQKYQEAYAYWANGGKASNQTFDQFKSGYINTVRVSLQLGAVNNQSSQSDGLIAVPVTLESVVNVPNSNDQQVQQFSGTYTVQPAPSGQGGATGQQIVSANIQPANGPLPPTAFNDPVQTLQNYYTALNRREFAPAYTYWNDGGIASQQTFPQFAQGFADTDRVVVDYGTPQGQGAAGSLYTDIPVVIVATKNNRAKQSFCGTYTLRRLNVPPFDKLGWRIESAKIAPTADVNPGSDQAKQLLSGGCKS